VPTLVHQGVRYEQLMVPSREGLPHGGYVVATEVATGARKWIRRVYETVLDPTREVDVQFKYFKRLTLERGGQALLVEDERGGQHRLELGPDPR
jgi:hypothetical protein